MGKWKVENGKKVWYGSRKGYHMYKANEYYRKRSGCFYLAYKQKSAFQRGCTKDDY